MPARLPLPYPNFWYAVSTPAELRPRPVPRLRDLRSAPFLAVHGTLGVPEVSVGVTPEGVFHVVNRSRNRRFGRTVDTAVDIRLFFPGFTVVRFNELAEVLLLSTNTPLDEGTVEQRFFFTARKRGNPLVRALVAWMFMREVSRQYEQDVAIWEHKVHLPRPVL